MEILKTTEAHKEFREKLKAFLDKEVIPNIPKWEKDHIVPREVWKKMGDAELLCTNVDKKYGGLGLDFSFSAIVCEEMTRSGQTGLAVPLHSDVVVPYITEYGSEELKKKYLPGCASGDLISAVAMTEPDAGSDISAIQTTAVEDGDEIVISGSKTFISNGIICDFVIVAAKDPAIEDPYQALSLYIVDDGTPGFERGKHLEKMGWHSQDTAELFFNNCRIPKSNILGEKGLGFLMLMGKLQQERLVCAIGAIAASELMVESALEYFKEKSDASGKPLSKFQSVQFDLVEMATEVKMGRTFVDKLIVEHIDGLDVKTETSMAKYWTTDLSNKIGGKCLEMMEEIGTVESNPLVQGWRDARVTQIFAGTNEVMKYIIAKLLGL